MSVDRLACDFAENVPESHVNSADGVGHGTTAALPEGILMESFGGRGGIDRRRAFIERSQIFEGALDQRS